MLKLADSNYRLAGGTYEKRDFVLSVRRINLGECEGRTFAFGAFSVHGVLSYE